MRRPLMVRSFFHTYSSSFSIAVRMAADRLDDTWKMIAGGLRFRPAYDRFSGGATDNPQQILMFVHSLDDGGTEEQRRNF